MTKSIPLFAVLSATAMFAHAKTVLWYHFDEAEPGTATTAESKILNAADPETLSGTPRTMSLGNFSWNNVPTFGTTTGFMPTYTNAFNGSSSWFDPVSGVHSTDRTALNFVRQYRNTVGGQNGCGWRSIVTVKDPDDALKLPSFTVECFVRFNPENPISPTGSVIDGESHAHIISMNGGDSSIYHTPWQLRAESSGAMYFIMGWNGTRYYTPDYPNGSNGSWSNPNWRMTALKDGRWHHVAMTVDGSNAAAVKVKTYVDYYNEKTYTMDAPITYTSGASLTIGGTTNHQTMALNADIDEVRISDTVLTADQFLHPYSVEVDSDTAIYISFDDWFANINNKMYGNEGSYYRKFSDTFLNEAGRVGALYCPQIFHNDYGLPEFTNETTNVKRWNIAATTWPNTNAYHFAVNPKYSLSHAFALPNPCQFEHNGGLTVEGFFKMDEPSSSVATTYLLNAVNGGTPWRLALPKSSYTLNVLDNWSNVLSTKVLADNAWHHIAVVSDEAKNEVRLYADYALVGTKTGFTLSHVPYAAGAEVKSMRLGDLQDTSGIGAYNGFLDEFRYTLRPLEPQEFLTTREASSDVLASASFENDLAEGPADYADLFAAGTLEGSGEFAKTRPFKTEANKSSIRLDGATVNLGRNILLEQGDAFTLEFCLRPGSLSGAANIVALMKPAPSEEALWSVALAADAKSLIVSAGEDSASFALPAIADWWHHYGLVFAKGAETPTVTLFVDHVQIGEPVSLPAAFGTAARSRGLALGSAAFTGWFDELRITKGALAPDDMMSASPRVGSLLFLR